MVAFSSCAMILGECSTFHSPTLSLSLCTCVCVYVEQYNGFEEDGPYVADVDSTFMHQTYFSVDFNVALIPVPCRTGGRFEISYVHGISMVSSTQLASNFLTLMGHL